MTTQRDEPARSEPETREHVLERVAEETPSIEPPTAVDPSTRRGFTLRLLVTMFGAAVIGYLVTFLIAGLAIGWGAAALAGLAGALIVGILAALISATGEDGRIARGVARREGPQPAPDETSRER